MELYPWVVVAHVFFVTLSFGAHGLSAFAMFQARNETDRGRLAATLSPGRQRLVGPLLAVVLMVGLAACDSFGGDNANGGLGGTDWTVVSIAGTETIPDARPTMRFAFGGQLTGSDGCNQYGGPFKTDRQDITIGQLTATLIGCEPLLGAQAQAFNEALTGAATWRLTEAGTLELRGHGDVIAEPLVDAPPPSDAVVSDLAGTTWLLQELGGATLVDVEPSVTFGGDGTVSGSAGCNTFNGTYDLDGASVTFGPLATTKMACADPTMFVESAFLAAMAGVTGWSVDAAGRLVLDGPRPLILRPA